MSLVFNNGKYIGKCSDLEVEKRQGSQDFVKLKDFELNKSLWFSEDKEEMLLDIKEQLESAIYHPIGDQEEWRLIEDSLVKLKMLLSNSPVS